MSYIAGTGALMLVVWVFIGVFLLEPSEKDYRLKDGRTIHCLVAPSLFATGISCDWQHARVKRAAAAGGAS